MAKKKVKYIWAVCYIDAEQLEKTKKHLKKFPEYKNIEILIPTVKVLKKTFKNQNEFEDVPLLFNYGFFKVPRTFIHDLGYFDTLKERIPVIYSWVKDPAQTIIIPPKLRRLIEDRDREEDEELIKEYFQIATVTDREIKILLHEAQNISIFDSDDLKNISEGTTITLRGYPWEDMQAIVRDINFKKEEVKVDLVIDGFHKPVTVAFSNVFYTIYAKDNHKVEAMREKSLEEMKFRNKNFGHKVGTHS